VTASNWDIDDAAKVEKITDSQQQEIDYLKSIEDIMAEKLKNSKNLFDAESPASHLSIMTSKSDVKNGKSASNSSKGQRSKMRSSQSGLKESKNESEPTSSASGSMSKTQTQQFSTETGAGGDFATVKSKDIEYINEELPSSMIKAIRIIERLLTQSKYHEQQVLYQDYPPVDIVKGEGDDDEEAKDGDDIMGFGNEKKKKEEVKDEEVEKNVEDTDEVSLTHLFKFRCDITDGRQVSCMDINVANPDLIAVGYGEFDIDCTKKLQPGILAFWTLKNPTFPEKIIYTEHSITCCAFSKKQPHWIAVGDSHGNISIFNIRSDDLSPIAESKDLEGKHTDIIWELAWVDREAKGEALVTISGDGRVIDWYMKRGLELIELTQLKRETNPN